MAEIIIPFDGKPLTFTIPDANLAEVLSPRASTPLADLEHAIEAALAAPIGQAPLEQWVTTRPTAS
jgi:hypothetical protein